LFGLAVGARDGRAVGLADDGNVLLEIPEGVFAPKPGRLKRRLQVPLKLLLGQTGSFIHGLIVTPKYPFHPTQHF
jgi:hypothetical protein